LSSIGNCQLQSLESQVQPCSNMRLSPAPVSVKNSSAVERRAASALCAGVAVNATAAPVSLSRPRRDISTCFVVIEPLLIGSQSSGGCANVVGSQWDSDEL